MKEDLKRLVKEFLEETKYDRIVNEEIQHTESSEIKTVVYRREPTFNEFIEWLTINN